MGTASSAPVRTAAHIRTSGGMVFDLSYRALIDHVMLLRQAIAHPEMTKEGETLDYFIKEYCHRMATNSMSTLQQQSTLSWQLDWIWHVHRLHPVAYFNDCVKQLSNGYVVDKKFMNLTMPEHNRSVPFVRFKTRDDETTLVPSIDLTKAIVRQRKFLDKFQHHELYAQKSIDLICRDFSSFEASIQKYVAFLKLARKNTMIVPTDEIDLIWHTHMRYPLSYREVTLALCGFLLNHDDSIEKQTLEDSYRETAARWKMTYNSEYGDNIDPKRVSESQYLSSCAMVYEPYVIKSSGDGGGGGCGGGGGG